MLGTALLLFKGCLHCLLNLLKFVRLSHFYSTSIGKKLLFRSYNHSSVTPPWDSLKTITGSSYFIDETWKPHT